MDERRIEELIDAATQLVNAYGDTANHTVAAATTTEQGRIFTSLNLYHFTGGPCAEVALLARLASEGERPVALVAVGDRDRGVLPPCSRCQEWASVSGFGALIVPNVAVG